MTRPPPPPFPPPPSRETDISLGVILIILGVMIGIFVFYFESCVRVVVSTKTTEAETAAKKSVTSSSIPIFTAPSSSISPVSFPPPQRKFDND